METPKAIKEALYAACRQRVEERIAVLEELLASIRESRDNETKSTAGDKHETGRAMMQQEEKNAQDQLAEARRVQSVLTGLAPGKPSAAVAPGSLVQTDRGTYYLSIGLGKVQLEAGLFYCISLQSPIGLAMAGLKAGERFTFNGQRFAVQAVW